jgi:hypothetical protein
VTPKLLQEEIFIKRGKRRRKGKGREEMRNISALNSRNNKYMPRKETEN